ncbi:zinc finger protein 569-like [Anastrepha obliqua]|uniref:zinc finger protein 569-like n=1 Tax=Anastrepha obliqua TaxID=95512 RepID=UPI00240A1D10|nr:zinc finger protein 569-like [Anastrepha obliqua]
MSVLPYQPTSDEDIFRLCTKECGIITATEDQQYFALGCMICPAKFLYFDAFIGHMQTDHGTQTMDQKGFFGGMLGLGYDDSYGENNSGRSGEGAEDLTDTDPSLLVPQTVMIKEEVDEEALELPQTDNSDITRYLNENELQNADDSMYHVKQECTEPEVTVEGDHDNYMNDNYGNYEDYTNNADEEDPIYQEDEDENNYDDLVEQSLLGGNNGVDSGLTMHIKDRKMIQFLIDAYRRNTFLWDHRHPQFRDRAKRQHFLDWIVMEFKRRFNLSLAKDAVTRKWDNLRTVYKRECNRMSLENTNISTLWYFKELHFLNRLYGGNQQMTEAVVKETVYRRRYSALWNDVSTTKLLSMVEQHSCFYNKYNIDYRSKEKRGEALQQMAAELQKMIDVSTIQISKRISQLRFDYSKQKQERLLCEQNNKVFTPSYTYYDQMQFMDADIAPFKCDFCPVIVQSPRELDVHLSTHQPEGSYACNACPVSFLDIDQLNQHKQIHTPTNKDVKYWCDLCTASFRTKEVYDEHMRRHNDELLLPSLANIPHPRNEDVNPLMHMNSSEYDECYSCDICGKSFANMVYLNAHRAQHSNASDRPFRCESAHCGRSFTSRQSMLDHTRQHYSNEEYNCDICGKTFKSLKNLQNHKQIHDAIKRYVCKICGSAFAQAAGLYLHKRRHNRPNSRIRHTY